MSDTSFQELPLATSPPATPRQVLLGFFILFQLGFLIVSNLLGFVNWTPTEVKDQPKQRINQLLPRFADERGHGWSWAEQIETNLRRWVQLTGQDQDWALFAPSVSKATGFPAIVLLWDDAAPQANSFPGALLAFDRKNGFDLNAAWNPPRGSILSLPLACQLELLAARSPWEALSLQVACRRQSAETVTRAEFLLSENEPADLNDFFRVGKCRVRRYEGQLYINPQPREDETEAEFALRLSRRMRRLLRDAHDPALEYLRWRLQQWQHAHPEAPAPQQVLLFERFYRIHGPDEPHGWDGPLLVPCARWQPQEQRKESDAVLEPFDFTELRFLPNNP